MSGAVNSVPGRRRDVIVGLVAAVSSFGLALLALLLDFDMTLVAIIMMVSVLIGIIVAVPLAIQGFYETAKRPEIVGRVPLLAGIASCVLSVLAVLLCLWRIQDEINRMRSRNNLSQIVKAMHTYQERHGHLPAAAIYSKDGKPLLSWRVAILPYIGQENLYQQFALEEPWDSAHNLKLLPRIPAVYNAPGRESDDLGLTFYQVFVGEGAAFEGVQGLRLNKEDFPDGPSNTILVVEAGEPVPWTKPADLPYDPKAPLPPLGGVFRDASNRRVFHAAFADGSVRGVRKGVDHKTLGYLITRNGDELIPLEPAGSSHR